MVLSRSSPSARKVQAKYQAFSVDYSVRYPFSNNVSETFKFPAMIQYILLAHFHSIYIIWMGFKMAILSYNVYDIRPLDYG